MVGAAKSMGHSGLIVYGTPGVVVLHHRQGGDDEREFLAASRKIGKKVRCSLITSGRPMCFVPLPLLVLLYRLLPRTYCSCCDAL